MLVPNNPFYTKFNHFNKVPSAVDSAAVNSKGKFGISIFFTVLASLSILVSEIAIM